MVGEAALLEPAGLDPVERALDGLGWSEWIRGPITVVEVSGDHLGLLRRPTVVDVGTHLRTAFEQVS